MKNTSLIVCLMVSCMLLPLLPVLLAVAAVPHFLLPWAFVAMWTAGSMVYWTAISLLTAACATLLWVTTWVKVLTAVGLFVGGCCPSILRCVAGPKQCITRDNSFTWHANPVGPVLLQTLPRPVWQHAADSPEASCHGSLPPQCTACSYTPQLNSPHTAAACSTYAPPHPLSLSGALHV